MLALGIIIKSFTDTVGYQIRFDSLWTYAFVSLITSERDLGRANRCAEDHIVV
jgi:hypothetical protein